MSTFSFSCVSFCFSYVYLRIMGIHKIVGFEQNYASNFKRLREKKEREGETTYYLHCFTCPWCLLWGSLMFEQPDLVATEKPMTTARLPSKECGRVQDVLPVFCLVTSNSKLALHCLILQCSSSLQQDENQQICVPPTNLWWWRHCHTTGGWPSAPFRSFKRCMVLEWSILCT